VAIVQLARWVAIVQEARWVAIVQLARWVAIVQEARWVAIVHLARWVAVYREYCDIVHSLTYIYHLLHLVPNYTWCPTVRPAQSNAVRAPLRRPAPVQRKEWIPYRLP
jgi:hypothetical protein